MVSLRMATIDDVKTIQELNNELFEYEMNNEFDKYVKNWPLSDIGKDYFVDLIKNQFVIIAEIDKKVIGYLAGSIYDDATFSYYDGITAEMDNMFIKEEYRRFGIGSKFVNAFLVWAKNKNAKRIFVTASSKNENTIKFYKKMGFEPINTTLRLEINDN